MANNTSTNPISIDTFSADVTITTGNAKVKHITFWSTAADDKVMLEDNNGVPIFFHQLATAKDTAQIDFGANGMLFTNGIILDVSDGTYTSSSKLLIYLG